MRVDPDRLLFMFGKRILIFLKSDSFYLPSVKNTKNCGESIEKDRNSALYDRSSGVSTVLPALRLDTVQAIYNHVSYDKMHSIYLTRKSMGACPGIPHHVNLIKGFISGNLLTPPPTPLNDI